jgi:NADH dehydrogenase
MKTNEIHVVTGAFGFSGKYIAGKLLNTGHEVRTLTNSPDRENPFAGQVKAYPYNFDDPERLAHSLKGASVLYNNYWVRFNYKDFTYERAVENSLKLFEAAKKVGIKRIVHISITNPSEDSPFEYFSGKAKLEKAIMKSGLSYAILRPAVLFGKEDMLINNIAWFLRRFPVFGVFDEGKYRLQPIYVDDMAELAVEQGRRVENVIINAIGPETFTYRDLAKEIGMAIGKRRPIISVSPQAGYLMGRLVSFLHHDVTITRDEIKGLMDDLLYTDSPPAGKTKLTEWIKEHASLVGRHYRSELARRENRVKPYDML